MEKPKIVWYSNFFDAGGYAGNSRKYVKGLIDSGWQINTEIIPSPKEINEEDIKFFKSLGKGENGNLPFVDDPNIIRVVSFLPVKMKNLYKIHKPRKSVIYSMMETQGVNFDFINRCNSFYDEMWTPTDYNKRIFESQGLNIPCKVLPIYIDENYKLENSIENLNLNYKVFGNKNSPEQPQGFKFLSVFRWSYRKGFDLLIKSYLKEFKNNDNVSLVIISRHAAMSHEQRFKDAIEFDINNLIDKYGSKDSPPIYWCSDIIPEDFMPSMYRIGDTYISCSRGEGASMTVLEAASMEIPVIAPYHTAYEDYISDDVAYKFDVDEWVVCNDIPEWNGYITGEFNGQKFPLFGDKKSEEVGSLMRAAMNANNLEKIENFKKLIQEKYSQKACIEKADEYLKGLCENA